MRLKQIALATLFSVAMALPALAQTAAPAAAPTQTTPATTAPAAVAKPAAKPAKVVAPVSINTGTAAELKTLPGIGKTRSAAIIKGRPYKAIEEIDTRKIVSHAAYTKVKALLTL